MDDKIPEGFTRDPDYWYRRWLFAAEQLDIEATWRVMHWREVAEIVARNEAGKVSQGNEKPLTWVNESR